MSCEWCDHGWVTTGDEYLDRHYPLPAPQRIGEDPALHAVHWETAMQKREAARGSVYPCPTCRPEQNERWTSL